MARDFDIDDTDWPWVRVRPPTECPTDEQLRAGVRRMAEFPRRGERYALLVDARGAFPLDARQRGVIAEESVATAELAARHCAGSAIVVNNAILAGMITAFKWLKPTEYPEKAFSTVEDARAWLESRMSETAESARRDAG